MNEKHIVKWIVTGQMIINGKAFQRHAGDEDVVSRSEMNSMVSCGQVERIGLYGEIMPKRILKGVKR